MQPSADRQPLGEEPTPRFQNGSKSRLATYLTPDRRPLTPGTMRDPAKPSAGLELATPPYPCVPRGSRLIAVPVQVGGSWLPKIPLLKLAVLEFSISRAGATPGQPDRQRAAEGNRAHLGIQARPNLGLPRPIGGVGRTLNPKVEGSNPSRPMLACFARSRIPLARILGSRKTPKGAARGPFLTGARL